MKIFISYKSDQYPEKVDELQARLELPSYRFQILRDKSFIKPGNFFDEAIEQQLRDSDIVLILMTNNTLKSKWVMAELRFAFELNKPIIPIWLEEPNLNTLPFYVRYIEYLEMWNSELWEKGFEALVQQLNNQRQELRTTNHVSIPTSPPVTVEDSHVRRREQGNPFIYGGAIQDNLLFCGRRNLLEAIPDRVVSKGQLQSISLVGNRRIGKSSVLHYLARNASDLFKARRHTVVAYLDMQPVRHTKGAMFAIREELSERLPPEHKDVLWEKSDDGELVYLAHCAKTLHRRGVGLILLLDEVESLLAREELDDLVETLRSIGSQGQMAMVTASADTLYRLYVVGVDRFRKHSSTSAFYNIFETEYVGLLNYSEWSRFVLDSFQSAGKDLSAKEMELISELAGGHSYFTQLASSLVFQAQIDKSSVEDIRKKFEQKAHDLLDDLWSRRTVPNQHAALYHLLGIDHGIELDEAAFKTAIDELKLRGVVTHDDQIFSTPFRNFIINAPAPSSTQ